MSDNTAVDRLYVEAEAVTSALDKVGELSLKISVADSFRKALLLAAASYFEHTLCAHVLAFVREQAKDSVLIPSFAQNKGIARQYHTWFQWDGNNANQFFSLFGTELRSFMQKEIAGSVELREAVKAFLELGNDRNRLVHQDYATFVMDKTLDEVYVKYRAARFFVDFMPQALRRCEDEIQQERIRSTSA